MPRLQYPNPNKSFKLFTDVSKHSYSGILHQKEVSDQENVVPNLVPIAYISGSFSKTQHLWNSTQKGCYTVYRSIQKFSIYLAGTKCTLYCNHKLLAPFSLLVCPVQYLTTGLWNYSSLTSSFSKKNVVVDTISRLRTLVLYQDNSNDDLATTDDDVVKEIVEEVQAMKWVPNSAGYKSVKVQVVWVPVKVEVVWLYYYWLLIL